MSPDASGDVQGVPVWKNPSGAFYLHKLASYEQPHVAHSLAAEAQAARREAAAQALYTRVPGEIESCRLLVDAIARAWGLAS